MNFGKKLGLISIALSVTSYALGFLQDKVDNELQKEHIEEIVNEKLKEKGIGEAE